MAQASLAQAAPHLDGRRRRLARFPTGHAQGQVPGGAGATVRVPSQEALDQSGLRPDAISILNAQVEWLKEKKFLPITIEGHADEQGTREYNLALGARRATAVREFLLAKGIEQDRISIVTYGKERPLRVCSNEECWSKNRRAVTVVGKKL